MQFAIKDIVKDNKAHFYFYRRGNMFYTVTVNGTKWMFSVSLEDIAGASLFAEMKAITKGFVRIRHFGFLANRSRAALLPRCFAALHTTPPENESQPSPPPTTPPLWRCPKCGGPMAVVQRFTAAQLQLRSPPLLATAA